LIPIFIQLVRFFGPDHNFINDKTTYTIIVNGNNRNMTINQIIRNNILITVNNISFPEDTKSSIEILSESQQNRILKLLGLDDWNEDTSLDFENVVTDEIQILMNNEPDFHPMTNMNKYKPKLIEGIIENYELQYD
jgi:hypothetical protein